MESANDIIDHETVAHATAVDPSETLTIAEYAEEVDRRSEDLITVIVPTHNDRSLLPASLRLLEESFRGLPYKYEVLVVDDRSNDGTVNSAWKFANQMPIRVIDLKSGHGRTAAIKDALDSSTGHIVMVMDPDMRFPADGLAKMLEALQSADVVVAKRAAYPSKLYALVSTAYRWVFGRVLLSIDADVRSGLKIFRRSILRSLRFDPQFDMRLAFDALLLYHARRVGKPIASVTMPYSRTWFRHGVWGAVASRVSLALSIVVLSSSRVAHWAFPFLFPPQPHEYFEAGFTNIQDYLFLAPEQSAKGHLTREVYFLIFYGALAIIGYFSLIYWVTGKSFAWSFFFHIALVQVSLILFKFYVVTITFRLPPQPPKQLDEDEKKDLPVISVILPVYKEKDVLPQLCQRMAEMDYPTDKLDLIFIFESGDNDTIDAFMRMEKPAHFKGLVSPDVKPKTKPKALNVALRETKGEFLVIFDAETLPEKDQFMKAMAAFKYTPDLDYVHCRIDVYNARINWLTKMYAAEFAFFYNFFLPGLATVRSPTPISGHSVYFRRQQIIRVGGWDAYNLAEDCDIGIRMFRQGYQKATVLDSASWEQSTTTLGDWIKQRTRWMQGFVQTSMVNLRFPALLWKDLGGLRNVLMFMFHVPGGVFLNGINLVQWCMLIFWFYTQDPHIETIFKGVLLYLSVASFAIANAAFTYFNLLGLFHRKYFSFVPTAMTSMLYWLMLSYATMRSIMRFFRQESTWDKTYHPAVSPSINAEPLPQSA